MAHSKKIVSGTALGTLLGSIASMMYPKRRAFLEHLMERADDINHLAEKAKEFGEAFLGKGKLFHFGNGAESKANYIKGGVIGFIVGATAALLIAPKSGKNFRGQIARAYNDISEKSEEFVHHFKNNTHNPFATHHHRTTQNGVMKKKKTATAAKRKAHSK